MISNHNIKISKTARYSCIGEPGENIKHVWLICHGYGYLAQYFIKKFEAISDEETLIIAPEGLHRFYLNGVSGRVGASWMTKEERETDIEDYINYLDTVYEKLISPLATNLKTINCLGFSQGGASISRWVTKTKHRVDNVIMWASVFPPDMNKTEDIEVLNHKNIFVVVGDQDEYITTEQKQQHLKEIKGLGINFHLLEFEGKHEIDKDTLLKLKTLL